MRWQILRGDCRQMMATLPDCSIDAIVTDPPYELGFMGKAWDASGIAYDLRVWREALRVLKPGGHLLAFSGSRTYHRMAVAIEDAGFEIRDQIMWLYGSGFPKSHDAAKAIDREAGLLAPEGASMLPGGASGMSLYPTIKPSEYQRPDPVSDAAKQWLGWGTALKPAHEPICVARKPLRGTVAANVLAYGTGAINVDGCRVGETVETWPKTRSYAPGQIQPGGKGSTQNTGDAPSGRWPANVIHDGSEEVVGMFPDTASGQLNAGHKQGSGLFQRNYGADSGSAALFFYSAKASRTDRDEGLEHMTAQAAGGLQGRHDGSLGSITMRANVHPTVKPTDLMRYLCRLVTPPGGTVLDPFTGSGSTGKAAMLEGFRFIGCELSEEYAAIAEARIRYAVLPIAGQAQDDDAPSVQPSAGTNAPRQLTLGLTVS
jgi:site-specific DNA-methyltransferase (adenine-specific)